MKPIDLQDNLSKTLLAQQVADRLLEGEEKSSQLYKSLTRQSMEEQVKKQQVGFDEKRESAAVRPEGSGKHGSRKHKKKKKRKTKKSDEETALDLRKRREDDDYGKGELVDIEG